jgi:SAM-dependent methyltransferase
VIRGAANLASVSSALSPVQEAIRRRVRALAAHRAPVRRLLTALARETESALGDGVYEGEYFGLGRDAHDRAFLSGYERYDRDTSNANVAAYLAWSTFPVTSSLDVGCATGFVVEALRELGVVARGVDVSQYAVDHAAPGARGHIGRADLRRGLPFSDGQFELVTALETLEHLDQRDIPRALAELRRVTRRYVLVTIPSFGANRNGPGGWYQVKVRDDRVAYYESLGPEFEGPIPFGDLYRDARGAPIEGHLTVASFGWWTDRFAEAGLVRCDATERRLQVDLARFGLTKYWNLYVFRLPEVAPPNPDWRADSERSAVALRLGLDGRRAAPDDLAALEAARRTAPPLDLRASAGEGPATG